jgi:hypothetical protein
MAVFSYSRRALGPLKHGCGFSLSTRAQGDKSTPDNAKSAIMPKVKVYKVKIYNVTTDESGVSRRMATEKGAAIMGGAIIPESAVEIEADLLEPGEEWTPRDFVP